MDVDALHAQDFSHEPALLWYQNQHAQREALGGQPAFQGPLDGHDQVSFHSERQWAKTRAADVAGDMPPLWAVRPRAC